MIMRDLLAVKQQKTNFWRRPSSSPSGESEEPTETPSLDDVPSAVAGSSDSSSDAPAPSEDLTVALVGVGKQPPAPDPNQSGVHVVCDVPSVDTVHGRMRAFISRHLEEMLIPDDTSDTEKTVLAEDRLLMPWYHTIAKIASRDIIVCGFPVSASARAYLKRVLTGIKNSEIETATWKGKVRWWLSDKSTVITGEDRVQRIVSAIIRAETTTYAFESTPRKKVAKNHRHNDPSIFRQVASAFEPPRATREAIAKNKSNHPIAAASRRIGVTATSDYLANAGFQIYDESISNAARDAKKSGRREVHGIKDLQHSNPDDEYKPGMVYAFVDQDMYINSFDKYAGENIVIITPEYDRLAGESSNSSWYYTTAADGSVVVTERVATSNGATFPNQRPWDYSANDFIFIEHLGKHTFTTYNVNIQFQPLSHHKWVWLSRNTTTRLSKALCDMMHEIAQSTPLDATSLRKADNVEVIRVVPDPTAPKTGARGSRAVANPNHEIFLLGMFGDPSDPKYSIKYADDTGPNTSMELTENQYRIFSLMGKNRPKGYGVSEVKRTMQMHTIWRPGGLEPLLVAFFGIPIEYRPRPNIMYTRRVGSVDEDVGEEGNAVEAAPNPAGGGPGVADTKSDAAHAAYKKERLEAYKNLVDPPSALKEVLEMLLQKFIKLVSGETGIALSSVPLVGRELIFAVRTKALQAARLQRKVELDAEEPAPKTNLKVEVGPKASVAPRGTTQLTEEMAIQTGRVGRLIKEVLLRCKFFQPGKTPQAIARAIRELVEIAAEATTPETEGLAPGATPQKDTTGADGAVSGLHDTDYTKMDETISKYIYEEWFVKFVLAFVHPSDYEEVKAILAANVDFMSMLNGALYNVGFKNSSGSGTTSELNTLVAAFLEYVATCLAVTKYYYRSRHKNELDMSKVRKNTVRTALNYYVEFNDVSPYTWGDFMFEDHKLDPFAIPYAVIGPKYGDDGIGPHLRCITDADWGAAAGYISGAVGMVLKVAFSRPEGGTFFLGRHYPKPLESLASYADVPKAIRKLSLARNQDAKKYQLKLLGYWTTDSKTPGLREYLTVLARMHDVDLHAFEGLIEFDEHGTPVMTAEMQYLLDNDSDMFYRVAGGPYCVEDEDVPMMLEAITPQCGFEFMSEFNSWLESLAECNTWEELDPFLLPGMDFDPDAEPKGTVRMAGPVARLLADNGPDGELSLTLEELSAAAEIAYTEYVSEAAGGDAPAHSSE